MQKENKDFFDAAWSLSSMTGLGRARASVARENIEVIARSVNFRGLDVKCRLPHDLSALEPAIHKAIDNEFSRGRVEIDVKVQKHDAGPANFVIDDQAATRVFMTLSQLRDRFQIMTPVTIQDVLAVPGIIRVPEANETEVLDDVTFAAVIEALQDLKRTRAHEGVMLVQVLKDMLARAVSHLGAIRELARADVKHRFERLKVRLKELDDKLGYDEERLHQEVALLVERSDFTEEIDRLDAHTEHFAHLCHDGGAVGRKLDFLCQEMLREANTLLSKAFGSQITIRAIDLKAEIERIREQVQNIE